MDRGIKIFIAIVILGLVGYFSYHQIIKWHQKELDMAISQERTESEKKTETLEAKINRLEEELTFIQNHTGSARKTNRNLWR